MAKNNYARVYELELTNPKKLDIQAVFSALETTSNAGTPFNTGSGICYVKDVKEMDQSFIVLFGKDNEDASNYKRNRKQRSFAKIDIDEGSEVLADFVHVGISKNKRLGHYTVLAEKNRMFRFGSLYNLFYHTLGETDRHYKLGRRAIKDYQAEINKAKRIINVSQIDYQPSMPHLPGYHNEDMKTFTLQQTLEIKAIPRGSIGKRFINSLLPTISKKDGLKTVITIVNKAGIKVSLDFDEPEAEMGLTVDLPMNFKTEKVQKAIAEEMDKIISKDNEGKL